MARPEVSGRKLPVSKKKKTRKAAVTAPVPPAVYSISEFCEAHHISQAFYYKIRAAGLGPREHRVLDKVTVTLEAAAEWRNPGEVIAA